MSLDFDPLFDKTEWEDKPERVPSNVQGKHKTTKLDATLKDNSFDNRHMATLIHILIGLGIFAMASAVVIFVILAAYYYAFK